MNTRFEYGFRYPNQTPEQTLGPFTTEERARHWVAQDPDRILMRRPAGTDDHWRNAP